MNNNHTIPLKLSFLVFSMLLNSMGIVILQLSHQNISYCGLSFLESFKDLPIALTSLFSVNYINKFGFKKSLVFSLFVVAICCFILPFLEEFWFYKIWFVIIGISFAIAKIAVFAIIRTNIFNEKELNKNMNSTEAYFMIGIFVVNISFGWLLNTEYSSFWKFGFWGIAFFSIINIFLLLGLQFKEVNVDEASNSLPIFKEVFSSKNIIFLVLLFLVVFIEVSFNSWMPAFFRNNLGINSFFSLQTSAFLALFSFIGRILASRLVLKFPSFKIIIYCLFVTILLLISSQLLTNYGKSFIMVVAFPFVGLFTAPLYPLFNSKFLYNFDKSKAGHLISLIVIFSSLGSSFGSIYMGLIFQNNVSGYFPLFLLIPIILILIITLNIKKSLFIIKNN